MLDLAVLRDYAGGVNRLRSVLALCLLVAAGSFAAHAQSNLGGGTANISGTLIPNNCVKAGPATNQIQDAGGVCGTGTGNVSGSGLTLGQPIIGNSGSGIITSAAYLDASAFSGGDSCAKMSTAMTASAGLGQVVDARAFTGNQICSVNPIPANAASILTLGPATYWLQAAWGLTNRFAAGGVGWERNPSATPNTGTTLKACAAITANCAAVFPTGIGGALTCITDENDLCRTSKGVGAGPVPLFDSYLFNLTIDCDGVSGAIGFQDFNGNENSGYRGIKVENCLKGNGRSVLVAGSNFQGNFTLTFNSATFTGTGFQSDMIGTQYKFPGSSDPTTNYIVTSINSAGTSGTLDVIFAGANITTAGTVNNSNTQNGYLWGLYSVSLATKCADATSAGGKALLVNTGSGSNKGPRIIGDITAVDGCGTNATADEPNNQLDISGTAMTFITAHMESCQSDCAVFGANSVTNSITAMGLDAGSIDASGGSVWKVSNAFASEHLTFLGTKALSSAPTNLYVDQINSVTVTSVTKKVEGFYAMANGVVLTTSQSVTSKLFALTLSTALAQASGGLGTAKIAFAPPTTAATIAFSADNTTTTLPLNLANAQTGTYQAVAADFAACKTIPVASGTFTLTLVASGTQPANGQCIFIVNYGTGVVTVARSGQNINGSAANYTLPAGAAANPEAALVWSDGTNYFIAAAGGNIFNAGATCGSGLAVAGNGTNKIQCLTQLTFSATGTVTKVNNVATVGTPGVETSFGNISLTAQTAAITTATLCAAASCLVGQYNVDVYLDSTVTCATPGTASVGISLTWTDEIGTKSAISVPLDVNGGVTLLSTMALGNTTNSANGRVSLWTSGANPIQYATSYTGCTSGTGTYAIRIVASEVQ